MARKPRIIHNTWLGEGRATTSWQRALGQGQLVEEKTEKQDEEHMKEKEEGQGRKRGGKYEDKRRGVLTPEVQNAMRFDHF